MRKLSSFLVRAFEYAVPDPFVLAIVLTLVTAAAALLFAPHHAIGDVLAAWYKGIFDIFAFALQMILILVTGYALARSTPVRKGLMWIAGVPRNPRSAVVITFLISALACWINWGFGLVVAGLLARAIAQRMQIDFGWLVAAAYSGFVVWASGLSSSIALAQSTHGNDLNVVEKLTGATLPLGSMLFAPFNVVPIVALLVIVPLLFLAFEPREVVTGSIPPSEPPEREIRRLPTLGSRLERAWILNLIVVAAGCSYLFSTWTHSGFSLDIKSVIFIFLLLGLLLHWTPVAYVRAVEEAARITGPLLAQYPLYGGIWGIMQTTGLAGIVATWFLTFSTSATLPFWSYLSSIIISLFVPSGGGHWAIQGPFVVPAAAKLGASQAATAMAVAIGEEVANMIQPFWCLPVLAIAGVGLQRVMAFTSLVFIAALIVFGASLLLLVPHP